MSETTSTNSPQTQSPSHDLKRKKKSFLFRHWCITGLAICITSLFALLAVFAKPLDPVKRAIQDFSFTDIYYEILKESTVPDTAHFITIVDMTELTNRSDIAQLLDHIEQHQPKVVGLDVCFDNEGEDFEGNDALIQVAEKHKNIVFSLKMLDWKDEKTGWTKAIHSFFHEITALKEGTTNMPRALYDNMKRRVPMCERYQGKLYPSFVTQVANTYAEKDLRRGRTEDVNINFSPTVFRVLKPEEVLDHPEMIQDQIVLVGAMYEDTDTHWTPIGKIAGVELLAYGIQSVICDNEVKTLPFPLLCLVSLVVILVVEILQQLYLDRMAMSKSIFVRYIIGSAYIMSIFTVLFTTLLLGISFIIFKSYNLSFNLAWALSVITFLGTSRSMYNALHSYFEAWQEKRKPHNPRI